MALNAAPLKAYLALHGGAGGAGGADMATTGCSLAPFIAARIDRLVLWL